MRGRLALISDAYMVTPDYRMVLQEARAGVPPNVKLDGAYKFVDALNTLVPNGPPSLIGCKKLTVEGKVAFAAVPDELDEKTDGKLARRCCSPRPAGARRLFCCCERCL